MKRRTFASRISELRLVGVATVLSASSMIPAVALAGAEEDPPPATGACQLTVLEVWCSDTRYEQPPVQGVEKPSKILAPYAKALEKATRRKYFSITRKPFRTLLRDKHPARLALPQGYSALWELLEPPAEDHQARVRQTLTNPKKKTVRAILKRSPLIQELPRIQVDGKSYVLVVEFGPPKPPEDGGQGQK